MTAPTPARNKSGNLNQMDSHPHFFKLRLTKKLDDLYKSKSKELIEGRFGKNPTASRIGLQAARSVSYLQALVDVGELMKETEDELNGEIEIKD